MSNKKLQADLFKGAAQYYSAFRPGLPPQVAIHLKDRFNLDGRGILLDMGCGTGLSTFPLAPFFEKTIAFDTDEEMLNEAKKNEPLGFKIEWQQRSDKEISVNEGPYRLAIACRAFNWMDQYPLLQKLHSILEPGGGVALIGDGSFWTGNEPWQKRVKEVIQGFLGQKRRAGNSTYSAPDEPYIVTLKNNGYDDPHYEAIPLIREWKIQSIIGYLYSTSFSAKHLFGDRLKEFEEVIKEELIMANNGKEVFVENTEFVVQSGFHR
ncbi:MAG: class I SAM-dependent methyltransferase [Bacteroidetes bacterium]|nr:class I SAM-dependent methyltransferase [Bacteroidota bacterium]